MLRSAQRCAADPGPILFDHTWVPALRSSAKNAAPRPGHELSQPRRRSVHRDQFIDVDARAHHRVLVVLDQHFGHQRTRVVGAGLHRAIGAGGHDRHEIAGSTVFVSHETYTPARGGSASAEINALRSTFGADADAIVIANTKGFTGHAMGAGIEDVVAIKALETGIVPPVPNFKEADPELGELNLSQGGSYPVRHALRLAAGFGSQIAMSLLRWTPLPDGRHRSPSEDEWFVQSPQDRAADNPR